MRKTGEKMFCTNCGKEMPEGARFCVNCGAKMVSVPSWSGIAGTDGPERSLEAYPAMPQPAPASAKRSILPILIGAGATLVLICAITAVVVFFSGRSKKPEEGEAGKKEEEFKETEAADEEVAGIEPKTTAKASVNEAETTVAAVNEHRMTSYPPGYFPAMQPIIISQGMTSESSILQEQGAVHHAYMAFDLKPETSWQEGRDREIGEYVQVNFGRPQTFRSILFHLGNFHTPELFRDNSVPTRIRMTADDRDYVFTLDDNYTAKAVIFAQPVTARTVRFTVESIRPGAKYSDTCISEITLYEEDISTVTGEKKALAKSVWKYAAGSWEQVGGRWRFKATDGNYLSDGWYWLDANMDRIAEAYSFDAGGYLNMNRDVEADIGNSYSTIYVGEDGAAQTYNGYYGFFPMWKVKMPDCQYTLEKKIRSEGEEYFEYKFLTQNGYNNLHMFDETYGSTDENHSAGTGINCISPFGLFYSYEGNDGYIKKSPVPNADKGSYFELPVSVIFDYSEDSLNLFMVATVRFTKDCIIEYNGYSSNEPPMDTLEHYLAQERHDIVGNFMIIEEIDSRGYATRISTFAAD